MASQVHTSLLFKEALEAISDQNHDAAITTHQSNPNDADALQSKAIVLIKQEKHFKALETIKQLEIVAPKEAYCLSSLNRHEEAYLEIEKSVDDSFAVKNLKAQISHPDFPELFANYQAAIGASLLSNGSKDYKVIDFTPSTHEILFNLSCIAISEGDLDKAKKLLDEAACNTALCNRTLKEEMYSKDEIYQELVPIKLQQAYIRQLQGEVTESARIYSEIIENKVEDSSMVTVATNNLLSTKGFEEEVFETLHTLKKRIAEDPKSSHRLLKMQKAILAGNEMALFLRLKQFPHSFSKAKKMESLQPTGYRKMHSAVVNFHQNRPKLAIAELQKQVKEDGGNIPLNFALAQLFIQTNRYDLALDQLEALRNNLSSSEDRVLPGLIGTLAWLYEQTSQPAKSEVLLAEAAKVDSEYRTLYESVLKRKQAMATLSRNQPEEAAVQFQSLLSSDPGDLESLRGLIKALSLYDPALAEQYLEAYAKPSLDPASLEDGYLKRLKQFTSVAPAKKAKVKKCKRRNKPPKNFNPNVKPDPQRWLRMSERSYFKNRINKPVRGNQGASIVEAKEVLTLPQSPQPSAKPKA
ncbi:Signal recognition particle subunit SRP72, partial [Massospora cicadina]